MKLSKLFKQLWIIPLGYAVSPLKRGIQIKVSPFLREMSAGQRDNASNFESLDNFDKYVIVKKYIFVPFRKST